MRIDVFVHLAFDPDPRLDQILSAVKTLIKEDVEMSASVSSLDTGLGQLKTDVGNLTTVVSSAQAALGGLSHQLAIAIQNAAQQGATADQLAMIQSLHSTIQAENDALAQAIAANTGAANETPPATDPPAATEPPAPTEAPAPSA
jgi:hypothetical protein